MKNDGIFLQFMFKLIYLLKTISDKLRLKSYLFYMFYTNKNFLMYFKYARAQNVYSQILYSILLFSH